MSTLKQVDDAIAALKESLNRYAMNRDLLASAEEQHKLYAKYVKEYDQIQDEKNTLNSNMAAKGQDAYSECIGLMRDQKTKMQKSFDEESKHTADKASTADQAKEI